MTTVFTICAIAGGTVLLIQLAIAVLGMDSDINADFHADGDLAHHDATFFFGVLSVKALVAALAFFGLGGLAGISAGFTPYTSILAGLLPAALAMIAVAWLMRMLHSFDSHGNVDIRNAIGVTGTVYLTVPGHKEGAGKVTVTIQDRTMEYVAVTGGDAIPTGAPVVVVEVMENGALEVKTPSGKEN